MRLRFGGGVESNPLPAQATQPLSCPPDTVEISAVNKIKKPKDKMSTGVKVGIAALGVLGSAVTACILIPKHQTSKLTKLCNEKMQLQNLAEHIDFKDAKTVEEGIKFAKDVLKIGEVKGNFTLDAINYANRGLVDVSNANKGHLFMPKKIFYKDLNDNVIAFVRHDIKSENFGEFVINKKFFDRAFLKPKLKAELLSLQEHTREQLTLFPVFDESIIKLVNKYFKDNNSLNTSEMRDLLYTFKNASTKKNCFFANPLCTLQTMAEKFKSKGINVNIDELSQLSYKKQKEKLKELLTQYQNNLGENQLNYEVPYLSPIETVYHEMGHLQDYAKNLKELNLKPWKLDSNDGVEYIGNHWGGLTYDGYKELFEKNPTKFKKCYPDLYEFLTNQEYQQTAGKVSEYAQTSIGEFIAETYAKMVHGDKLSNDVMKLYEKYNGPKLGG